MKVVGSRSVSAKRARRRGFARQKEPCEPAATGPFRLFAALLAVLPATACGDGRATERPSLVVFAAASLRDVATELAAELEKEHGVEAVFNFAGSNTLAQQIHAAPRADEATATKVD